MGDHGAPLASANFSRRLPVSVPPYSFPNPQNSFPIVPGGSAHLQRTSHWMPARLRPAMLCGAGAEVEAVSRREPVVPGAVVLPVVVDGDLALADDLEFV